MSSGNFELRITGTAGEKFDVYSSADLRTWTKISTVTLSGSSYDFVDNTSTGTALRFYRAVAAP
jgi:hypothetical protein